jgi:hypothetical protein
MRKCLACPRTDADVGTCGKFVTCPNDSAPINPKTDVVLRCNKCDLTRAFSAVAVLHQTAARPVEMEFQCPVGVESCQAFVMQPDRTPPVAKKSK